MYLIITLGIIGLAILVTGSIVGFYFIRNRLNKHEEFDATKDLFI